MKITKTSSSTVLHFAILSLVVTTSMALLQPSLAQNDLVPTLPEFGSFLDGGPDSTTEDLGEANNGRIDNGAGQTGTGSDNSAYEEFQGCLSAARSGRRTIAHRGRGARLL